MFRRLTFLSWFFQVYFNVFCSAVYSSKFCPYYYYSWMSKGNFIIILYCLSIGIQIFQKNISILQKQKQTTVEPRYFEVPRETEKSSK